MPVPEGGSSLRVPTRHVPALDGLRALAVIAVLAYHVDLVPGGFVGVQVFFVLSGFLITTLLVTERDRTGTVDLRGFYVRRAARLVPAAVTVIALASIVSAAMRLESRANTLVAAVASVLYVSNLLSTVRNQFVGILNFTWSLSQEEQFYLAAPWFLRRSDPARRGHWAAVLAGVAVALAAARAGLALGFPGLVPSLYHNPLLNTDAMLAGVALALAYSAASVPTLLRSRVFASAVGVVGLLGVVVVVVVFALDAGGLAVAEPVAVLGAVGLLVSVTSADGTPLARVLASRVLQWVGRQSYSMYLVQVPLLFVWRRVLGLHPNTGVHPALVATVVASTVVVGAAATRWVEIPVRRWARRRFPDRGRAAVRVPDPR